MPAIGRSILCGGEKIDKGVQFNFMVPDDVTITVFEENT
jgi:hypothetical protein